MEICVQKEKPANVAGVSWLGSDALFGTMSKTTVCNPSDSGPIHILGVSPHMHLKGKHMKGIINRKGGTTEVLQDAPFDFNNQSWYQKDFTLMPGDTITTTCDWSAPATFGKATTDEMCYLFTVSYPKGLLGDGGPIGTGAHGGPASESNPVVAGGPCR